MRTLTLPLPAGDTWTRADYEALPNDLPARVSLIHGQLVIAPRPGPIHQRIARRLATHFENEAPAEWQVDTHVDVLLDDDPTEPTVLAPDVVAYSTDHDPHERPIPARLVTLAADVVPASTTRTGWRARPALYAEAGIRHYWRAEADRATSEVTVYAFELDDATGDYVPAGAGDRPAGTLVVQGAPLTPSPWSRT